MALEDIIYELTCLQETMLLTCGDRSGKEDPVFAHHCMAPERIVRDLEEAERRIRTETAGAQSRRWETPRQLDCTPELGGLK